VEIVMPEFVEYLVLGAIALVLAVILGIAGSAYFLKRKNLKRDRAHFRAKSERDRKKTMAQPRID
jgi:uncharacterized protein HemX